MGERGGRGGGGGVVTLFGKISMLTSMYYKL